MRRGFADSLRNENRDLRAKVARLQKLVDELTDERNEALDLATRMRKERDEARALLGEPVVGRIDALHEAQQESVRLRLKLDTQQRVGEVSSEVMHAFLEVCKRFGCPPHCGDAVEWLSETLEELTKHRQGRR